MDDLLERARKSLNTSLNSRTAQSGQAHALDSIASSLLYIARNMNAKPEVDEDRIELVLRRLLDTDKQATLKKPKGSKK